MKIVDDSIKLKKIDLGKTVNCCEHPDINRESEYLVNYDGHYLLGKFYRVQFGWSFNYFWSDIAGMQLNSLIEVWEVLS